jgi:hypothetical protein
MKKKTPVKRTKLSVSAWQDIKAAYLLGGTLRGLAREANMSENTLLVKAHREKWSDQRQAALAKILPMKSHEESLGISQGRLMERHLLNMMAVSQRLSNYAHALPDELAFDAAIAVIKPDQGR